MSQSAHQARVEAFLRGIRRPIPDVPTVAGRELLATMGRTLLEETLEWLQAAGLNVRISLGDDNHTRNLVYKDFTVTIDATREPGLVEMAKEAADVSVVTIGNLISCGIRDEEILRAVDENNLLKVATGSYDLASGKFVKAPNHPKTDLKPVLREQGWRG